jgi:hypothetical protein
MENLIVYMLVGFLAQMIDGSLGMAYGVSATISAWCRRASRCCQRQRPTLLRSSPPVYQVFPIGNLVIWIKL